MDYRERIITELQMLTNVVTNDFDYLVYLLLKDGSYLLDEVESNQELKEISIFEFQVQPVEEWFSNNIEEVKE